MHYVCFSVGSWEQNASFVRLREFGGELARRGHDVSYVVDDTTWNREHLGLHRRSNVVFVARGSLAATTAARRRIVKQLSPDFLHVINPSVKAYLALSGTSVSVVGDWDEWPAKRNLGFVRNTMNRYLDDWLRRCATTHVVASQYLKHEFKTRFNQRTVYIPNATHLERPLKAASPYSEPTFVYMGNLHAAYDYDLILDAAKLLRSRGMRPQFELVGGGPELESTRQSVKDCGLDNVHLPGFCRGDQLWRRLQNAHALLFPIRETLLNLCRCPMKTYSYAQARRPIIANRVGEVAAVLGAKARYVDPTAESFAAAIEQALGEPVQEVNYEIEKHNWVSRTDDLLAELMVRRRQPGSQVRRVSRRSA